MLSRSVREHLNPIARSLWRGLPKWLRHSPLALRIGSATKQYLAASLTSCPDARRAVDALGAEETPIAITEVRTVSSLTQLDEILAELDAAAAISDDALRRIFPTFRMESPLDLPPDPYSDAYRKRQIDLYEHLAGKPYSTTNEISEFDVRSAADRPFPFSTGSAQTVGNHLIAIGHLIRTLNLPTGSTILEFGPGWGNTTVWLARMGYKVTAVDIEKRFVDLIAARSQRKGLNIELIHGDFQMVHTIARSWNAVVFFECFHHCADHHSLVAGLQKVVAPGGKVIFAAEPITDDFPIPWGLRLDGESLWAIRRNGWCELGFRETYFRDLLASNGWVLDKYVCTDPAWATVFVATRREGGATP
jgi:SAM-dependent methyltransferase